jgi:hypothetical protein
MEKSSKNNHLEHDRESHEGFGSRMCDLHGQKASSQKPHHFLAIPLHYFATHHALDTFNNGITSMTFCTIFMANEQCVLMCGKGLSIVTLHDRMIATPQNVCI